MGIIEPPLLGMGDIFHGPIRSSQQLSKVKRAAMRRHTSLMPDGAT